MAKQVLPTVVVDSCIILDFLTGIDAQRQVRARQVLEQHNVEHSILLPAIVIPEISGSGSINGDQGGKQERQLRIDAVHAWIRDSQYEVAELTERMARQAARLATDHKLKGCDATVLATALAWNCTVLYTRDGNLLKVDGAHPGLKIESTPLTTPSPLDPSNQRPGIGA